MTDIGANLLPFMKPKKAQSGVIVENRGVAPEPKPEENQIDDIEICANDLLTAIENKDVKGMAIAIRAAFECMQAEQENSSLEEDNSFAAQNIKAAQENR